MGCGTGILSIMAARAGATRVTGIDVDGRACASARENLVTNHVQGVDIREGDARLLDGIERHDLLLANIDRDTLLEEMTRYAGALRDGGTILASGFLVGDLPLVSERAAAAGLVQGEVTTSGEWCIAIFNKPGEIR